MKPTFTGEVQLAGWSDTHTGGSKVTFWLSSREDLDIFRDLTVKKGNQAGHRFMAALVEIGDDEQPADSDKPNKGGAIAKSAGMLCDNPAFWRWAGVSDAQEAADFIRESCGIKSRAELDHNREAEDVYHTRIRIPFSQTTRLKTT